MEIPYKIISREEKDKLEAYAESLQNGEKNNFWKSTSARAKEIVSLLKKENFEIFFPLMLI